MGSPDNPDRELMTAADVARTISRMAHQIIEKTAVDGPDAPRVVLLGIPTRGVTLAARMAEKIKTFSGVTVPHGGLDITLYRDDLDSKPPRPLEDTSIPAGGIDNALVILVDDVLYTGRSVRAALDALRDIGRPNVVQLAVLVDHGLAAAGFQQVRASDTTVDRVVPQRVEHLEEHVVVTRFHQRAVELTVQVELHHSVVGVCGSHLLDQCRQTRKQSRAVLATRQPGRLPLEQPAHLVDLADLAARQPVHQVTAPGVPGDQTFVSQTVQSVSHRRSGHPKRLSDLLLNELEVLLQLARHDEVAQLLIHADG